jgi:hypothetical protein
MPNKLKAPTPDTLAEPHYYAVENYRGDPFEAGKPVPYRKGSALHRALRIFADCNNPISRRQFIELGGTARDLDRLITSGKVREFVSPAPTRR